MSSTSTVHVADREIPNFYSFVCVCAADRPVPRGPALLRRSGVAQYLRLPGQN